MPVMPGLTSERVNAFANFFENAFVSSFYSRFNHKITSLFYVKSCQNFTGSCTSGKNFDRDFVPEKSTKPRIFGHVIPAKFYLVTETQ